MYITAVFVLKIHHPVKGKIQLKNKITTKYEKINEGIWFNYLFIFSHDFIFLTVLPNVEFII